MTARIHPLSGQPINGKPVNGKPRAELQRAMQQVHVARMSFDAARAGTELDAHFRHADSLDPDSSYQQEVRHKLIKRSRYEQGSNGIYDGIITTHCNMLVGVGPTLRMLTGNRGFNQLIEREFFKWMQQTQLRRKLWAMCHSRTGDGESFATIQTNPALPDVQLDFQPIEPEQCQTPYGDFGKTGFVDGIYYDEFNNIVAYDILPQHPGSSYQVQNQIPIKKDASEVLHWFKLKRPGAHRGIPDCTSSLPVGAHSRRHREATVASAETAADISALIHSSLTGSADPEPDPQAPYTSIPTQKRMVMTLPMGWTATQMKGEHPNAQYVDFHRLQVSETARPLSMPYNAAACDSSTYSFASGKLDTLCYRAALDVERQDCNDLVLEPIFAEWFREWRTLPDDAVDRRIIIPSHQWDWPAHPVIDEVAFATACGMNLASGIATFRGIQADLGRDYEDTLAIQAEDWFGDSSDENVLKARQINLLRTISQHAIPYVAQIMGLAPAVLPQTGGSNAPAI